MARRKKDVTLLKAAQERRTKNSKLTPKKIPEMLPGHVEARMIKCGKPRCKCSRGQLHGLYFYRLTWSGNKRHKSYIRLADLPKVLKACQSHREFQAELRNGREKYRNSLAGFRQLLKLLGV